MKKIGKKISVLFSLFCLVAIITVIPFGSVNAEMATDVPIDSFGEDIWGNWSIDSNNRINARCPAGWTCEVECSNEVDDQGGFFYRTIISPDYKIYYQTIIAKYDANEDPLTNPDFDGVGLTNTKTNAKFSNESFVQDYGFGYWSERPISTDQHNHIAGAPGEDFNAEYEIFSETDLLKTFNPGSTLTEQGLSKLNLVQWFSETTGSVGDETYYDEFFKLDMDPSRLEKKIVTIVTSVRMGDGGPTASMSDGFYNTFYHRLEYTDLDSTPSFGKYNYIQRNAGDGFMEEVTISDGLSRINNIDIFQTLDLLHGTPMEGIVTDNISTFDYRLRRVPEVADTDAWTELGLTPAEISGLSLPVTLTLPNADTVKYYADDRIVQSSIGQLLTIAGGGIDQKFGWMKFENMDSDEFGASGSQLKTFLSFVEIPPQSWVDGHPSTSVPQMTGATADLIFQKLDRVDVLIDEKYIPDAGAGYVDFETFIEPE